MPSRKSKPLRTSHDIRFVNSIPTLEYCLLALTTIGVTKMAIDLEGVRLSRSGRVSLIQIMTNLSPIVWVIDITTLGVHAFQYICTTGWTLKTILEDSFAIKMLFDVRNDSDSLYNLYNVLLANVYDLQLLEVAVRRSNGINAATIKGLSATITEHLNPDPSWKQIKDYGGEVFKKPENQTLVEQRPLDPILLRYAAQDVTLLFELANCLEMKIGKTGKKWIEGVFKASTKRVNEAKRPAKDTSTNKGVRSRIFAPYF